MINQSTIAARNRTLAGLLGGVIGSLFFNLLADPAYGLSLSLVIGAALGLFFGLFFGQNIRTAGAGLVWGQVLGVLWWLAGSLTLIPILSGQGLQWSVAAIQAALPLLLGQVVGYGAVLGLSYYCLTWGLARVIPVSEDTAAKPGHRFPVGQNVVPPLIQAIIIGGLGGLIGSWVFARGIETAEFFPLVAGLMGSNSMMLGQILHYLIGLTIGVSFGIFFYRDVQGAGSGLVWGVNYGLLWWVVGPMTLLPWFLGAGVVDWSLAAAQKNFPALIAHMLYGGLVGLVYALANKLWQVLFVDSDPLNRALEGTGARGTRSLLLGLVGGIVGGLLFTVVMVGIGALPKVAGLIGARSAVAGFVVHLIIAIIIGGSYGLLFQREAYSLGSGMAWGIVYGLVWWLMGALTLFFVILRQPVDWSLPNAVALYPSLIGHLLYGAGLGLFFQILARRYDDELSGRPRRGTQGTRLAHQAHLRPRRRTAGTPAPALWVVTLVLGVTLPLLLL